MSDDVTESAKAVQEVAKTTSDLIKASEKAGSFFAKHIDAPLEAAIGHITDRLQFSREIRRRRLLVRFKEEMEALGVAHETKRLPLAFAIDAIEQGSLEDDDDLQDLWVRLLANAASADAGVQPRRSYISILKDLTALDARVLQTIYSETFKPSDPLETAELPDAIAIYDTARNQKIVPSDEIKASLSNMERLRLLAVGRAVNGTELHYAIYQSFLGHEFMRAVKRTQRSA